MTDKIDKILQDAEETGVSEEIKEEILALQLENMNLKNKNRRLQIENSNSRAEQFKQSNANLKAKNKELNEKIKRLKKNKSANMEHLSHEQLGVYNRMLLDYEAMDKNYDIVFPGNEHPIFSRFNELANKYPNREFILSLLHDKINSKKELIDFEIDTQKKNIKILEECYKIQDQYPDTWEDEVNSQMLYLCRITDIDTIKNKIKVLRNNKKEIDKWMSLKDNIQKKPSTSNIKLKNNLYYSIENEFDRIFDLCQTVGSITKYKATIVVDGFNQADIYSALTRELEKQVGLCEEPYTHNFYYSNGEGRLVPYQLNRQFLKYINDNTNFVKYGKKNQYKSGDIINSKILFEDIPLYCNKIQYRNTDLVGFNNCFYNVQTNKIVPLNPQTPIMPLKNTQTELYLDEPIEMNPMEHIFNECFTDEDRETLLAYIGCCLYDKGYTQRQESIFLLGKGGTGKTTLSKAICSIFYKVGSQLVSKLTEKNQFGFSLWADNDIVIVDEIQSSPKDFGSKFKELSGGQILAVEKKHYDTINIPPENVPHMFFIGNNFSQNLYEESIGEGIKRRMLIVIPTKKIQSLGYNWNDLVQDSCQQWLVQEATKVYLKQELHKSNKPINFTDAKKEERLKMCTFPERYFLEKHFQAAYIEGQTIDNDEQISYDDLFNFISRCINHNMLEATIKQDSYTAFSNVVKKALKLPSSHNTRTIEGVMTFTGIVPKSDAAIEYFKER